MPRRLLIDCDPGTDDALALLLAIAAPELALEAVTVAAGNVGLDRTVANAAALIGLSGSHVPVHAGAHRPLTGAFAAAAHIHGDNGLGGIELPPAPAPAPTPAIDAIRAAIRAPGGDLTLVGIGPATNLALALAAERGAIGNVAEVVLMAGAVTTGNITPQAEFNAWNDPEALSVVLAAGAPVTLATLDLTRQARVTPARLAALRAAPGGACLRVACDILAATAQPGGAPLHDPCTIAWLLAPGLFTHRQATARVALDPGRARGRTVIDDGAAAPASPVRLLETVDADGLFVLLAERLARLP
jgi:purine nucleosidase